LIDGILIVDKEKRMTSHDVVNIVRRKFGIKKVGHAGTLDPNATGVLVLLLGKATKLSASFLNQDKEYIATMKLGEKTDSGDCEGEVISRKTVVLTDREIEKTIGDFGGELEQVPPMMSAKRVKGKRLYKMARRGICIERDPVKVFVKDIKVLELSLPLVVFSVICSKGTYIRQLASDIGDELGCGAHLTDLQRTRSGSFKLEQAVSLAAIKNMTREDLYESTIRI